ncbi:MAG: heavy metal translocating P-type ATPase, partial [Chryseotalea sp.]
MQKNKMVSGKKMEQKDFPVLEMSCAACAISVATVLKEIPGVSEADVNYANQSARVVFDASLIKPEQLQLAVRKAGYDLVIEPSAEEQQAIQKQAQLKTSKELREKTLLSILFTIPVVVLGMLMMDWYWGKIISLLLTTPVIFYFGRNYFIHTYKQALLKRASMDTLVALSTGIAYGFSVFNTFYPQFWHSRGLHAHVYFEAAAVVITFISLGKWLEENAKQKTGTALQKLMELQPNMVRVLRNNEEKDIAIKEIQIEEKIVVRPGEKIAVDGTVISGHSFVNESTITGEPIPAEKTTNSKVYAGTVNQQGSFIMVAQKIGSNTLLAHIIQAVKQAQGSRADVQKLADKVAGIFVPVVIGIATVTFLIWFMFGGDLGFSHGLLAAVT